MNRNFFAQWVAAVAAVFACAQPALSADAVEELVYDYPKTNLAGQADVIIYNAKVLTVDSKFSIASAIAIKGDKILGTGQWEMEKFQGLETKLIDAHGATVLPGLYDGQVSTFSAAMSELDGKLPALDSIAAAKEYIRKEAAAKAPGSWIVIELLYPTRVKEGRLPTKAELDEVAPNNPVYWDCGALGVVNSRAMEVSRITKSTDNPRGGEIVHDPKTYRPTGLLRNGASLLKLPAMHLPTAQQTHDAVTNLYYLYNQQGITSIGERIAGPSTMDFFRQLEKSNELTVRINCTRVLFQLGDSVDDAITNLDSLTNMGAGKLPYGPTGAGDDWVRVGPLKVILDGDLGMATAYMRYPYGIGPTYQIDQPAYRGHLAWDTLVLGGLCEEAARRGWQLKAQCTGDAAMDALLNCYQRIQFQQDIRKRRFLIERANFQSDQDWEKCQKLGIAANVQPIGIYKDAGSLTKTLGEKRMKYYLPLKSWIDKGLVIGGASGHIAKLDSVEATNPWNPWLGMWVALTRKTEQGTALNPEENLTREQAIRLYTINNCYLNFEESKKGSVETGKYADLIIEDTDLLKCPVDDIRATRVLLTMVGGKIVWQAPMK